MIAINGISRTLYNMREVMWQLELFRGCSFLSSEWNKNNPEENYGLSDKYVEFLKKNTIKYYDRLCELNRQQYLSGYGFMQGYFSIGTEKMEGNVMAVHQLNRPSIDTIIDYCNDLAANEKLEVFEFGKNNDLVLHIYKDEEYNASKDKDYSNLVRISTAKDGKWVDDTEDIYVTDDSLYRELERINSYEKFSTL